MSLILFSYILLNESRSNSKEGWRALDNNTTLHKYSNTFTKFLLAILRSTTSDLFGYKFPLSEHQLQLITDLSDDITNRKECQVTIHKLLLSIFSAPSVKKISDKWSCPLLCFLAIDNMRDDGSFNEAHHLTSFLAQWEYIMRGIALYESFHTADQYENGILG